MAEEKSIHMAAGEDLPIQVRMILAAIYIAAGVGESVKSRTSYMEKVLGGVQTSCSHPADNLKALEYYWAQQMEIVNDE
ncbi:MAG: hypothetical protein V4438_02200 [Patescibacteria group bacterium]